MVIRYVLDRLRGVIGKIRLFRPVTFFDWGLRSRVIRCSKMCNTQNCTYQKREYKKGILQPILMFSPSMDRFWAQFSKSCLTSSFKLRIHLRSYSWILNSSTVIFTTNTTMFAGLSTFVLTVIFCLGFFLKELLMNDELMRIHSQLALSRKAGQALPTNLVVPRRPPCNVFEFESCLEPSLDPIGLDSHKCNKNTECGSTKIDRAIHNCNILDKSISVSNIFDFSVMTVSPFTIVRLCVCKTSFQ